MDDIKMREGTEIYAGLILIEGRTFMDMICVDHEFIFSQNKRFHPNSYWLVLK